MIGAPGGPWAYRIEAVNALGGMMDRCILGSADWYMAFGLVGAMNPRPDNGYKVTDAYKGYVLDWMQNAGKLKQNVGYVEAHLIHKWHGSYSRRQYGTRYGILERNAYDPHVDVQANAWGVYELRGNKPRLRDEIRRYFRDRREDNPE